MRYRILKIVKNDTTMFFPQVEVPTGFLWFKEWRGITMKAETSTDPYYKGFDYSINEGAQQLINEHHRKLFPISSVEVEYINK